MKEKSLIDGINKSLINASDLIKEANILFEKQKNERAYFLFQISIEEIGKAQLLLQYLLTEDFKDPQKCKRLLKDFKDHRQKTTKAIGIDILIAQTIKDSDLRLKFIKCIISQYDGIDSINDFKNYSLYTTYKYENFILPTSYIDEGLMTQIKNLAELRLHACEIYIPAILKSLEEFRPMFINAVNTMTNEQIRDFYDKLINDKN